MIDSHGYAQLCRLFTDEVIETMGGLSSGKSRENEDSPVVLLVGADVFSRASGILRWKNAGKISIYKGRRKQVLVHFLAFLRGF